MLKDRGIIKWTSLMLPEHINMLKQLWEEDDQLTLPVLDEQQLVEMNELLHQAYEQQIIVQLTWHNSLQKHLSIGKITEINPDERTIRLQTAEQSKIISTANILNITRNCY